MRFAQTENSSPKFFIPVRKPRECQGNSTGIKNFQELFLSSPRTIRGTVRNSSANCSWFGRNFMFTPYYVSLPYARGIYRCTCTLATKQNGSRSPETQHRQSLQPTFKASGKNEKINRQYPNLYRYISCICVQKGERVDFIQRY